MIAGTIGDTPVDVRVADDDGPTRAVAIDAFKVAAVPGNVAGRRDGAPEPPPAAHDVVTAASEQSFPASDAPPRWPGRPDRW